MAKRKVDECTEDTQEGSTKDDKVQRVAEDLFDVVELIKTVSGACSEVIQKISKTKDFTGKKSRTNELTIIKSSLDMMQTRCDAIRTDAGKKSRVGYTKNREIAEEKHNLRECVAVHKSEGLDCTVIQSDIHKLTNILKEKPRVKQSVMITPVKSASGGELNFGPSRKKSRRLAKLNTNTSSAARFPRREIEDGQLVIHSDEEVSHAIPPPLIHLKLYTHREFILIYHNLEKNGVRFLKKLVYSLKALNMLSISYNHLLKLNEMYKAAQTYIESERNRLGTAFDASKYDSGLPPISQVVAPVGAPKRRNTTLKEAADEMNADAHRNVSKATNPIEDAEKFLHNQGNQRDHITASDSITDVSESTVKNYAAISVLDKDVSLINMENTRKKSLGRQIASTSHRTLVTHCLAIICSHFEIRKWDDKPHNLSEGAEEAYKLAKHIFKCDHVRPIQSRFQVSYDEHGFRFIPEKGGKNRIILCGKVSTKGGDRRSSKGVSSEWQEAKKEHNNFKGITCKVKEVNCAGGQRGRVCLHFPGFSKEELGNNNDIVIFKCKGLGYGHDLQAKPTDYGWIILSCSTESSSDEPTSVSVRISQFVLDEVVFPFIKDLKEDQPEDGACFTLDSDIPTLSVLKRKEQVEKFSKAKVKLIKIAGGFTECGSANDRQSLFKNQKREQRLQTCTSEETPLKQEARRCLENLRHRQVIKFSQRKFDSIVDCIATFNRVNDMSCRSREDIEKGYFRIGSISLTSNGKGYNSCPDLYNMIRTIKNRAITDDMDGFIRLLYNCGNDYYTKGNLTESEFDSHDFPLDKKPDGSNSVKKYKDGQYHLMRTTLPFNDHFVQKEKERIQKLLHRKIANFEKISRDIKQKFKDAEEAETILHERSRSLGQPLSGCPKAVMIASKLSASHVKAFIHVRLDKDYACADKKMKVEGFPTKKGKLSDFLDDESKDFTELTAQLEVAYRLRSMPVICQELTPPTLPNIETMSTAIPQPTMFEMSQSTTFLTDRQFIDSACDAFSNMSDRQSDFCEDWKNRLDELNDSRLAKILQQRLANHLQKFQGRGIKPNNPDWSFIRQNLPRMAVLLKMLGYVFDDKTLKGIQSQESLFCPEFLNNFEVLNKIHAKHHGAYLLIHKTKKRAMRSGSASSQFGHEDATGDEKGRVNQHIHDSKKQTNNRMYLLFPYKDSCYRSESIAQGDFDDLIFCPAFRFKDEDKIRVQDLFLFDETILTFLENRNPNGCKTIEDKKHRLVCYLLETALQLCLAPDDDLSENPGCECYSMVHGCGMVDDDDIDAYGEASGITQGNRDDVVNINIVE